MTAPATSAATPVDLGAQSLSPPSPPETFCGEDRWSGKSTLDMVSALSQSHQRLLLDEMAIPNTDASDSDRVTIRARADGSSKLSPAEKEFQQQVESLYMVVGGADFRRVAESSVQGLETLMSMVRESLMLLRVHFHNSGGVVSVVELKEKLRPFIAIYEDARQFVTGETAAKLGGIVSGAAPPRAAARRHPGAPIPDSKEVYDVSLLLSEFGDALSASAADDELQYTKELLKKTTAERNSLQQNVEQLEKQFSQLTSKLSKELDAVQKQRSSLEAEVAALQDRFSALAPPVGRMSPSTSPRQSLVAPMGQSQEQPTPVGRGSISAAQRSPERSPIHPHPPEMPVADVGSPTHTRGPVAVPAALANPAATGAGHSEWAWGSADPWTRRYNKVGALYSEVYKGHGMDMVWAAVDCVYKREYDEESEGYPAFLKDFRTAISGPVEKAEEFQDLVMHGTPLRADYVANCLQMKVKPNSGVIKLLTSIASDREVETLSLNSNYIGDHGIAPLVPLLTRLYRLKTLNLADNGIKNAGVRLLCQSLLMHPSLKTLNLSNNFLSRNGAKDILNLVSANGKITTIDISGMDEIDEPLAERIKARVANNAGTALIHKFGAVGGTGVDQEGPSASSAPITPSAGSRPALNQST